MKIKLANIVFVNGFIPALSDLLQEKLPVIQAYELRKFAKQVDEKAKLFDEARKKLVDDNAKKDKDGNQKLTEDKESVVMKTPDKFNKEFVELLNVEEEYEIKDKIKLSEDMKISSKSLGLLEKILEVE